MANKLVGATAWLIACSSTPSTSPSTTTVPPPGADWSCATPVTESAAQARSVRAAIAPINRPSLTVHATLAVTNVALAGLDVRTCSDAACSAPLAEARTDENGVARLSPWGPSVTIGGTANTTGGETFFGGPFPTNLFYVAPGATTLDAEVYDDVALLMSAQVVGVTHVDGSGIVLAQVHDCSGAAAANVTLTVEGTDTRTTARYFQGDQALATGRDATDATGRATLFNVPPGPFRLIARDVHGGSAVAAIRGYVPAAGVTHVEIAPTVAP
jgi:hypothetical protein